MPCLSGLLVTKELNAFSQVIGDDVQRPLTVIVGGAKITDKILVVENLIHVCIGRNHYLWRNGIYIHEGMLWDGDWKVTIRY
jgi:hypothetical protein